MEGLIGKNVSSSQRHGHGIAYDSERETPLPAEVEHDTVDNRLLSEIMSRQSMLTGSEPMTTPLNNVDLDMALLAHIERIDGDRREAEVRQSTVINSLSNTRHSIIRGMLPGDCSDILGTGVSYEIEESDCHVLISGPQATDTVVIGSIEARTGEAMQSRRRIRAISIRDSPIVSLASSVCAVFPRKQVIGSPHEMAASAMSFLLDSQLHHLSITHAGLQVIEPCIGRFDNLLTLDLSRNQIVRIRGQIELPCLLSLDLSNNMLSSVDFLQNLRCLSSLCLHSNCVTSLAESVNTMVPLGRTLKRFDMRRNAVRIPSSSNRMG
jgi:Leucine-rich repeat (LRR) protein